MGLTMNPKRKMRVFENGRFMYAKAELSRFRGSKFIEKGVPKTMRKMIGFLIENRSENGLKKRPRDTQQATKNEHRKTVKNCMKKGDVSHARDACQMRRRRGVP